MEVIRKVRTVVLLDANARWLALASGILPIAITAGFRIVGVARTQGYLRAWASGGKTRPWTAGSKKLIASGHRAQRMVRRNTGIGGTCLVRSLTLWALLLRFGLATDLRLGMRKRDGSMEGHAWLEYQGAPINESNGLIRTYETYPSPVSFDAWLLKGR